MSNEAAPLMLLLRELRRRRVFRTAAVYLVGAWLMMQVADVLFPAWGLPNAAINVLFVAAVLCFPLALVFGWRYDITSKGIVRTPPAQAGAEGPGLALQRGDHIVLAALVLVAGIIVFDAVQDILRAPLESGTDDAIVAGQGAETPSNSIAVLPFANISDAPGNEAFCDGVTEEILHKLGEYRELHIIARTSSFAFKDSDYQVPRIATILGVRFLLQGSVRRFGDKLRISAQLVDASGAQRWSDQFDRQLEDIFDIQTEIADIVATTIVPQIMPRHVDVYEPDIDAYEQFLLGRDLLHKRRVPEARVELAKAIELDPGFAAAHAEYAISLSMWGGGEDPDMSEQARHAVDKALELSPELPRALAAQALLYSASATDHAEIEAMLRRVLSIEPTMVDAMNWLASSLIDQGRVDEAIEWMERAWRVDPLHASITANLAIRYSDRGDFDRAERLMLRHVGLPSPSPMVINDLASFYRETAQLSESDVHQRRLVEDPVFGREFSAWRHGELARTWALLGEPEEAMAWVQRGLIAEPADDSIDRTFWYQLHYAPEMWQGNYVDAIASFEQVTGIREAPVMGSLSLNCQYGMLLSLAAQYTAAVNVLTGEMTDTEASGYQPCELDDPDASSALAWALIQSDKPESASPILAAAERRWQERDEAGTLHSSDELYLYALNAVLLGEHGDALDRLQRAIDTGWREYYLRHHDPRWNPLRDNPRYQAMMETVKADVDRQRAAIRSAPIVSK